MRYTCVGKYEVSNTNISGVIDKKHGKMRIK